MKLIWFLLYCADCIPAAVCGGRTTDAPLGTCSRRDRRRALVNAIGKKCSLSSPSREKTADSFYPLKLYIKIQPELYVSSASSFFFSKTAQSAILIW